MIEPELGKLAQMGIAEFLDHAAAELCSYIHIGLLRRAPIPRRPGFSN
jgi:hypothetical protein